MTAPRRIAVLDVGKTSVKLVLVDAVSGAEVSQRAMPNRTRGDGPYPHADTEAIAAFLVDGLADLASGDGFDALSITAHGATGALINRTDPRPAGARLRARRPRRRRDAPTTRSDRPSPKASRRACRAG